MLVLVLQKLNRETVKLALPPPLLRACWPISAGVSEQGGQVVVCWFWKRWKQLLLLEPTVAAKMNYSVVMGLPYPSLPYPSPSFPWAALHQASLSFTISWSLLKLMSKSVMPTNHLILCRPFFLLPLVFPSIRVFSNESALCIRWPKYWSFSFSINLPMNIQD